MKQQSYIEVYGARVHNLKNIDVKIPHKSLCVITGLSGSGKSSLAFDTLFAEGQRRYMETFPAYARQFLGIIEKPDVDKINGLSPVVAIEQKTIGKNPRSTVGTLTEINDFLRLWYAKASEAYSYITGEKMIKYNQQQIIDIITQHYKGKKIIILSPLVKSRKGHYAELFKKMVKQGYDQMRIDGKFTEIYDGLRLERYKTHNIELVIDKLKVPQKENQNIGGIKRLKKSIETAFKYGKDVLIIYQIENQTEKYYSRKLMCPTTGISYDDPAPNTFSFNSPEGYCPRCKGLGYIETIDTDKLIIDKNKSILQGAIPILKEFKNTFYYWLLEQLLEQEGYSIKTPIKQLPAETLEKILYGTTVNINPSKVNNIWHYFALQNKDFIGVIKLIKNSANFEENYKNYITRKTCPVCHGTRLKKESLQFKIADKNIAQLQQMEISQLQKWLKDVPKTLTKKQLEISKQLLKEIQKRVDFLNEIGLGYLSLDRPAATLSGGEAQRIRLATQMGSELVNVLYILDEPSIGLHPFDNQKLINSLKALRDLGNTIIVVEHDRDIITKADYIIDLGPGAGKKGGYIVAQGTPQQVKKQNSLTAQYLNNKKTIEIPKKRRKGNGKNITLIGATGNNLKNISVKFPLGKFICITGVSGSGKSTLISDTLKPAISNILYKTKHKTLPFEKIIGVEHINKIIEITQEPIGRTPRSNPATYTKVFDHIRKLFAQTPIAKIKGYKPGRFSFNIKGGRCETCKGAGVQIIEMKLLPDVQVKCIDCNGKRYNTETLQVKYKGKSIYEVLEMTINQAVEFFENIPNIYKILKTLQEVGLGYIKLGQNSTTLSGGEAQRIKLAAELSKRSTGNTLYILDEPTTGLHFEDIKMLLNILHRITDKGNTVIVIEHNLDVIKSADWIIDLGPQGGKNGGQLIFSGTPEQLINCKKSITAKFLKKELSKIK